MHAFDFFFLYVSVGLADARSRWLAVIQSVFCLGLVVLRGGLDTCAYGSLVVTSVCSPLPVGVAGIYGAILLILLDYVFGVARSSFGGER